MRVLLADDQVEIRSGLRLLLDQEPDLEVAGEVAEIDGLLASTREARPDVILLDWELAGLRVAEHLPILRALRPGLRIIALSGRPESRQAALASGADAFVSKGDQPEHLLTALRGLGGTVPSPYERG